MRPPQKTGENLRSRLYAHAIIPSFNEAPAENGGKLGNERQCMKVLAASMRPPQKTGENGGPAAARLDVGQCFNEAPAENGGKQRGPALLDIVEPRLQ